MANPALDLIGLRFGFLTVIQRAGSSQGRTTKALWRCQCDCGNTVVRESQYLRSKHRPLPRHCGCQHGNKTHGMSGTRLFNLWTKMLSRCSYAHDKDYKNYGGRGITVCKRWQGSFELFWTGMGPSYRHGLSLERRNNNRGYSPTNCYWATTKQQSNNTRRNVFIQTPIGRMTIKQAAEAYNIKPVTLYARLRRYKWPVQRALNLSTT